MMKMTCLLAALLLALGCACCALGEEGHIGYAGDYRNLSMVPEDGGKHTAGGTIAYAISGEIYQQALSGNPLYQAWNGEDQRIWMQWEGDDAFVINLYTGEIYPKDNPEAAFAGYSHQAQAVWVDYERVWAELYRVGDEEAFIGTLFTETFDHTASAAFSKAGKLPTLSAGKYEIRLMVRYTFGEDMVGRSSFTVEKSKAPVRTPTPKKAVKATPTPKKTVKKTPEPAAPAPVVTAQRAEPAATPPPAQKTEPVITPTPAPQWSAWSGWSTSPVSASASRQVETREEQVVTTKTQYTYSRWKYFNTDPQYNGYMYSYTQYEGVSYQKGSGKWEYKTTDTPLSKTKVISGHQQYTGYWYNEKVKTSEEISYKTYYRYRDRVN